MRNSLSEKFHSSKSKILLGIAILATTSGALFNDLNAQTAKNGGKAKTEQVDKNDILEVKNFMNDLNKALSKYNIQITLSPEQEKLAINGVGRMDSRGKQEAIKLIVNLITTGKVSPDAKNKITIETNDRDNIVGLAFDAIEMAYNSKDPKLENIMADGDIYDKYQYVLSDLTDKFRSDRSEKTKKLEGEIAQNKQEINQNKQEINQNKQEINQNKQEINQKEQNILKNNQEAEAGLLKIYNTNPNDPQLKTLAIQGKKVFTETGYKYSTKTGEIFAKFGIK